MSAGNHPRPKHRSQRAALPRQLHHQMLRRLRERAVSHNPGVSPCRFTEHTVRRCVPGLPGSHREGGCVLVHLPQLHDEPLRQVAGHQLRHPGWARQVASEESLDMRPLQKYHKRTLTKWVWAVRPSEHPSSPRSIGALEWVINAWWVRPPRVGSLRPGAM